MGDEQCNKEIRRALDDITDKEQLVKNSLVHINEITSILCQCESRYDPVIFQAIKSLFRIFDGFIYKKELVYIKAPPEDQKNKNLIKTQRHLKKDGRDLENETFIKPVNPKAQVQLWIRARFFDFINRLICLLNYPEQGIQIEALKSLMTFEEKAFCYENFPNKGDIRFPNLILPWIIGVLIHSSKISKKTFDLFVENYLQLYTDIKLYTLKNIQKLILAHRQNWKPKNEYGFEQDYYFNKVTNIKPFENPPYLKDQEAFNCSVLELLTKIKIDQNPSESTCFIKYKKVGVYNQKEDSGGENSMIINSSMNQSMIEDLRPTHSTRTNNVSTKLLDKETHKRVFTRCWTDFMKNNLSIGLQKSILEIMENQIIPYMDKPALLYDYLSSCFKSGGILAILAFGSLTILIRSYNVEYPEFFKHIYALFTPSIFYYKQNIRFFQLTFRFLQNSHVPLYIVCAFLKKLSRLSLTASPQGCMIIITFIYNIFLAHPASQILVHREKVENGDTTIVIKKNVSSTDNDTPCLSSHEVVSIQTDPYKEDELDPASSQAQFSSLWELKCLENHYVPAVSTLYRSLFGAKKLERKKVDLDQILSQSYCSLFNHEVKKKNQSVRLASTKPQFLFDESIFEYFSFDNENSTPLSHLYPSISGDQANFQKSVFKRKRLESKHSLKKRRTVF